LHVNIFVGKNKKFDLGRIIYFRKTMKIVRLFHYAFPFLGGAERLAIALAKALGLKEIHTLGTTIEEFDGIQII